LLLTIVRRGSGSVSDQYGRGSRDGSDEEEGRSDEEEG
jgi:hypothetical protein